MSAAEKWVTTQKSKAVIAEQEGEEGGVKWLDGGGGGGDVRKKRRCEEEEESDEEEEM